MVEIVVHSAPAEYWRTEENVAPNMDMESPQAANVLVNPPQGETRGIIRGVIEGSDDTESRIGDLEAQLNNAMTMESQNSDDKIKRETMLKFADWVFKISLAAMFSMLSSNPTENQVFNTLFRACSASLLGALLCSVSIVVLVSCEGFPCLAYAFEVIRYVTFGFLILSGFLAFALLQLY